jgi:hypothetical protein
VNEALEILTEVTSFMNEKVRHLENATKLLEVQKKIDLQFQIDSEEYQKWVETKEGKEPKKAIKVQIIQPHRILNYTQKVQIVDQKGKEDDIYLYLTNDLLFWCEKGSTEESLYYKGSINLKKTPISWVRNLESDKRMFQVVGSSVTILIKTYEGHKESKDWGEEKAEWMKKIEEVLGKIDFSKEKKQDKAKPTFTPMKETLYLKKIEKKIQEDSSTPKYSQEEIEKHLQLEKNKKSKEVLIKVFY